MNKRCRTTRNYIRKGITVCERWKQFGAFAKDMGDRPAGYSLERKDNSKGYDPDNCVWAPILVQANNTDRNRYITHGAETHTIAEWARVLGLSYVQLHHRLSRGWTVERALTSPNRKNQYA